MCRGPFLLSVLFSCQILCDSMDYNMSGSSVLHCLPEFAQIHVYLVKAMVFHHVWMWELDCKESWVQKNWCFWTVVLEKTLESPLDYNEIQPVHPKRPILGVHWKDWCWSWNSNTLATWWKKLTHWKRPWCWERLRAGGEGDNTGWDDWMASVIRWTWVWVSSWSWWWTGKPGVVQSMESLRVRHD